jgi:hypothetical protein
MQVCCSEIAATVEILNNMISISATDALPVTCHISKGCPFEQNQLTGISNKCVNET